MNIIVTGGAGFIGSNFVFHMLKKYPDYRIICLDKLTYAGNLSTLAPVMDNPNFRFVKADICEREAVNKLFEEEHPDIEYYGAFCSSRPELEQHHSEQISCGFRSMRHPCNFVKAASTVNNGKALT